MGQVVDEMPSMLSNDNRMTSAQFTHLLDDGDEQFKEQMKQAKKLSTEVLPPHVPSQVVYCNRVRLGGCVPLKGRRRSWYTSREIGGRSDDDTTPLWRVSGPRGYPVAA